MIHTQLVLDMCTDFFFKVANVYPFEELVQINIFLGVTLVCCLILHALQLVFYSLDGTQVFIDMVCNDSRYEIGMQEPIF